MRGRRWRIVALIAAKTLRQRSRDRPALLVALGAPLGLAMIFGLLVGPGTGFHAHYAVVDLDGGNLASALRTQVIGSLEASGDVAVTDLPTEVDARASIGTGADAAFIIPQGFTQAIRSGSSTTLTIVGAASAPSSVEVARAVGEAFGYRQETVQLAVASIDSLRGQALDPVARLHVADTASGIAPPVSVLVVAAHLRMLDLRTFFSASMAVLFLFLTAQVGMLSVFEERRRGTLARMLAGPVAPWTIAAGTCLGVFSMSLLAMAVPAVATTMLVGADWGPPIAVAALVLAAVTASLGLAALVTSLASSAAVAGTAGFAVAVTLAILGGSLWPAVQGPAIMSTLALLTPHGWFLRGLADLHGPGATVTGAVPATLALVGFGLATGALAALRERRRRVGGMIDRGRGSR